MTLSRRLMLFLLLLLPLASTEALAAKVSSKSLTLLPGENVTLALSYVVGTPTVSTSNAQVATAVLSGGAVSVTGLASGTAQIFVRDGKGTAKVKVTVRPPMTVTPDSASLQVGDGMKLTVRNAAGKVTLTNSNPTAVSTSAGSKSIELEGKSAGTATLTVKDSKTTVTVTVSVVGAPPAPPGEVVGTTEGRLLASNCFQCHGTYGSGGFDRLLGETEAEIYEELTEYKAKTNVGSDIMAAHVQVYTDEQLRAIARYLANP